MTFIAPAAIFALLIAPAIRLAALAVRTRETPEIWAAAFFVGTGFGLPLRVLGHSLATADPALAIRANAAGHVFFAAGSAAMAVFTWRVFRPASSRAGSFCIATVFSIAATTIFILASGAASDEAHLGMLATNAARVTPMVWAFIESTRYWRAMRRREALGLADPVVTNRFGLWACWVGGLTVLPAVTLATRLLTRVVTWLGIHDGTAFSQSEPVVFVVRIVFLLTAPVAAIALSLSFFPPARYLDHVRRRGARASDSVCS